LPKLPILTAKEAESLLLKAGFLLIRTKGSHRVYSKNDLKIVIPFHSGKDLHPKITKSVLNAIDEN
jgi:predicted RNA binding protein YcfA (HicA-like mRNA interferase family)